MVVRRATVESLNHTPISNDILICMKTTLNLPDALLEAVKRRAGDEGRTQTSVIEEAIRRLLSDSPPQRHRPMPTFGQPGANSLLIDLEDREALHEALDSETGA